MNYDIYFHFGVYYNTNKFKNLVYGNKTWTNPIYLPAGYIAIDVNDTNIISLNKGIRNVEKLNVSKCVRLNVNNFACILFDKLKILDISECDLNDNIFKYLPECLTSLNISSTSLKLTNIKLPNLTLLNVSECKNIDFVQIKKLTKLNELIANYTDITDDIICKLMKLKKLSIFQCENIVGWGLTYLKNLTYLDISEFNQMYHFRYTDYIDYVIGDLVKLETLHISGRQIKGKTLNKLIKLKVLSVAYTKIKINTLNCLNNLTELNIRCCNLLSSSDVIKNMNKLKKLATSLSLRDCNIPNLSQLLVEYSHIDNKTLAKFDKLTHLDISHCNNISKIKLNNLKSLTLISMDIKNIKYIDNLNNIIIYNSKLSPDIMSHYIQDTKHNYKKI